MIDYLYNILTLNYNGGSGSNWAGNGGVLDEFATFYANQGMTIPWSNTNARYKEHETTSTSVPASSIGLIPNYPVDHSIHTVRIFSPGVSQATAITNIESTLVQNEGIWFGFFLQDFNEFFNFWDSPSETTIWHPSPSNSGGYLGHAVLCIGYNNTDPTNPYWLMLNSWGTTNSWGTIVRPNGLFRVSMNINYDSYSYQWETLENIYPATPPISTLSSIAVAPASPASLAVGSTQQFTATGTYSNRSTADISSRVTWASSDASKATISSTGLATGATAGTANITAALSGITSPDVTLTVITLQPSVKIQSVTLPPNAKVSSGALVYNTTFRLVNNESVDVTVNWQANSSITGNFDSGSVTVPKNGYLDVTKGYYYITTGTEKITYTIYYSGTQIDSWSGTHIITSFVPNVKIQSVTLPPNAKVSSGALVYNTTFRLVNNESVDVTVNWQANSSITGNFDSGSVTVPKNGYLDVTKGYYYITTGTEKITYTIYYSGTQIDSWSGTHIITSFVPDVKIQSVTLPTNARIRLPSEVYVVTLYNTSFRLVNNESVDVTVNWQANSSITGNFDSGSVTVPKNGYLDITKGYYYTAIGTEKITYTIYYSGTQIDSWSGTYTIAP